MAKHILKCGSCGSYNLTEKCRVCGGACIPAQPPKFSPKDKYADYRRKAKESQRNQQGLI